MSSNKKNILVICAHSDDQIFGPGGSIAKYAREGYNIFTYIMSFGESGLPYLKKEVAIKTRVKESQEADKIIGGKGVFFFGLKEGKFEEDAKEINLFDKLKKIILEKKPIKIFTHSSDDVHVDHRKTNKIVLNVLNNIDFKCDVYSFDVWNVVKIKNRDNPKMYVNITKTFKYKIRALKQFQSQKFAALIPLLWTVYSRAIINGIKNKSIFAERFYKIK